MKHKVWIEIGRNIEEINWMGGPNYKEYGRCLYTWFITNSLEDLYSQATQCAKVLCLRRGEEFVDVTIYSMQEYTGTVGEEEEMQIGGPKSNRFTALEFKEEEIEE